MKTLFFLPFAVASFTAASDAFPCPDVRESPPWKEIAVYSVDEETGTLLKSRAWTPESPDYVAYSILHSQDDNDTYREQFVKGFFAYKREKDPVHPFSLVRLLPPQKILDVMKTFPSGHGMKNGMLANDSERYLPLRNDSYTPYWGRFDRILGMVQAEGRIYFFPDKKEKAKHISWDGEDRYKLGSVTPFPDPQGLLEFRGVTRDDERKSVWMMLDPVTGKSSSVPMGYDSACSFENLVQVDSGKVGKKESMRWCSSFEVVNSLGGETVRQIWTRFGEDIIIVEGKAWLSRGDNAVLLYPEPWEDSTAAVSVTLESLGSPAPGDMEFILTLKNASGKPVRLEQGWGNVILRFSSDGRFTCNNLCEVHLEPFASAWDLSAAGDDFLPEETLDPGESTAAFIKYSCPDWRIYPRDSHVFVKATFSTSGAVGTPGHGMYTSAPIKVPNPIPPHS